MSRNPLAAHMGADPQTAMPVVIETDNTGLQFGAGFPGYLGAGRSHTAVQGYNPAAGRIPMGVPSPADSVAVQPSGFRADGSGSLVPNPEIGGQAGRVSRLAYDAQGPAHSGSVMNHDMGGQRVNPGRPSIARGGPVGASGDLGQYNSAALALSTYDFPAQDISQLKVLYGL